MRSVGFPTSIVLVTVIIMAVLASEYCVYIDDDVVLSPAVVTTWCMPDCSPDDFEQDELNTNRLRFEGKILTFAIPRGGNFMGEDNSNAFLLEYDVKFKDGTFQHDAIKLPGAGRDGNFVIQDVESGEFTLKIMKLFK